MKFLDDNKLYTDTKYCLNYLNNIKSNENIKKGDKLIFHSYWFGEINPKTTLSIKSFLATQNLNNCELWLWLDEKNGFKNYKNNEYLKPLLPFITVKVFSPKKESLHTPLSFHFSNTFINYKELFKLYCYYSTKNLAHRSDFFRLLVLYKYGGVYFDLDMMFLRDFSLIDNLIQDHEYTYQWSSQPYGNSAIMKLNKESKNGCLMMNEGINNLCFAGWSILKYEYKHIDLYMLPSTFFDPLWLLNDKIDVKNDSPIDSFDEFFTESSFDSFEKFHSFFYGSFTYHWHNKWHNNEIKNSIAGHYNAYFDSILEDKFSIKPKFSFL